MRTSYVLIILPIALLFIGCTSQTTSRPQPKVQQVATDSSDLPPPGSPVVGRKPPMPAFVDRPSLRDYRVETVATGLEVPWDLAFVSTNRIYITERAGRVRLIEKGKLSPEPYARVNAVARGEGGLMGIALHPKYPKPSYVYLMYTHSSGNRISRFTDTGEGLANEKSIVVGIPSGFVHHGGIIRFGPDGMLYAGTGETGKPELAQDKSSLGGKILRMTPDGEPPADNPFPGSLVYAYGFRNVQGLAWNPANGDLWATMHGPTGEFGLSAKDEVFIVRKGGNHGWPRSLGVTNLKDVVQPILWYPQVSNPPSRAAFYSGKLMPELRGNFFFTSLAGEHLERVILSGPKTVRGIERWWQTGSQEGVYGRLRAVVESPDGSLYVATGNRDGRGTVRPGDDKILRIRPR